MNKFIQKIKARLSSSSSQEMIIGVGVVLGVLVIIIATIMLIQSNTPKIIYQPAIACDLFTKEEAQELLSENVLGEYAKNPTLQGNTITTKCSYTDTNPDKDQMKVAAVAIRSGINDEGVAKNKVEFSVGKSNKSVQTVDGVGDSAYFNPRLGQLNALDDDKWYIFSLGTGNSPETNTLENAIELSQRVLLTSELPTF